MPEYYFSDDVRFIQNMLNQLPIVLRTKACLCYAEVYKNTWETEVISYRRDNTARRQANIRLREFVRKQQRSLRGYTAEPLKLSKK